MQLEHFIEIYGVERICAELNRYGENIKKLYDYKTEELTIELERRGKKVLTV